MKITPFRIYLAFLLGLLIASFESEAAPITLTWTHDSAASSTLHYRLYQTNNPDFWPLNYTIVLPARTGSVQGAKIPEPSQKTWFRVTAINAAGESDVSNSGFHIFGQSTPVLECQQ